MNIKLCEIRSLYTNEDKIEKVCIGDIHDVNLTVPSLLKSLNL